MPWWRDAVIYQLYLRSFADGDGDGIGDLTGARSRLPYLRDLGVDAVWMSPWYASPMADGGYDVADYRAIEPAFGRLADAEAFIHDALDLGIRTIVDFVPNHVSDQHAWFEQALAGGPASPARDRFWFRPGRGPDGDVPPNGWTSHFGDIAWTRTKDPDGTPGDWYLHLFSPGQPDLNWEHPDVWREHEDLLRFWFDRGAAGVRIDSAALAMKHPDLPEVDDDHAPGEHPFLDRDELHDLYRSWRRVADTYEPPRVLIGEIWLPDRERFARYLRPDELHTAFNFDFLACPWEPAALRRCIVDHARRARARRRAADVGALQSRRHPRRYALRAGGHVVLLQRPADGRGDRCGARPAPGRAAALLALALPGTYYLYQGEELGLPEVEDLPVDRIQDPMHFQSGGVDPGRDGCRVPLPWSGSAPPFGFSPAGARHEPWLPQPDGWAQLTAASQRSNSSSMLELYRRALRARRQHLTGAATAIEWLPSDDQVLAFRRGDVVCVVNLSPDPVPLAGPGSVLVASEEPARGLLAPDATAWMHIPDTKNSPTQPLTAKEHQR